MKVHRLIIIFICIFVFFIPKNVYSLDRKKLIQLSSEIMNIYDNKRLKSLTELEKENIEQKFYDIKDVIQADLKSGDKNASIDIYLFLNGILKNDITSLQSLISSHDMDSFSKDLAQLINYSAAQKLSFALKESRIAYKTSIHIQKKTDQKDCHIFWNGKSLKNLKPILLPVGVPAYISIFCPNNLFEVKYIQSSETQSKLTVVFDRLKKIQFKNKQIIPNPNNNYNFTFLSESAKSVEGNKSIHQEVNNNEKNHEKNGHSPFSFGSGIGVLYDFGYLKKIYASQFGLSNGLLFTWESFIKYKGFLFLFDYAKIDAYEKKSIVLLKAPYNGNNTYIYYKRGKYNYYKPSLGYSFILNDMRNNHRLSLDVLLNYSRLISSQSDFIAQGVGLQCALVLSKQIFSKVNLDFTLGGSYSIGTLSGFQLISSTHLSYNF